MTRTATDPDTVPASGDNKPMKMHNYCQICHPDRTVAICGEGLLGIFGGWGKSECADCCKLWVCT